MPFQTITRAKRIPAETAAALGIPADAVKGENRLEVRNQGGVPEIVLIGSVGKSWWDDSGISEQEFRDALNEIPAGTKFNVRWNSEGGSVQEGLGIYNALKTRRADATSIIDGYALSIASVAPLAAGKVISPKSAIWMMHEAWSYASGNKRDMQKQVTMLAEHDLMLADIYAAETGKTKEECMSAMTDETWIRGSAAVEFGLADETDQEDDNATITQDRAFIPQAYFDRCKNLSPEILNAIKGGIPAAMNPAQPSAAKQQQPTKESHMTKEEIIAALKARGDTVDESKTVDQLKAQLLTAPQAKQPQTPAPAPAVAAQVPAPAAQAPAVDPAVAALQASVNALNAKLDAERKKNIEARIDGLIAECRLTNEERPAALARAVADETYLLELSARPVASFGTNGLGGFAAASVTSESPLDKILAEKDSAKRVTLLKGDWEGLVADAFTRDARGEKFRGRNPHAPKDTRRGMPVAANTYGATLVTAFLADGAVTPLQNKLTALKAFTRDYGTDRYKPRATAQVKKVTGAATVQTNATDFESGNSTVTNAPITVDQYTQAFHVSNDDLNSGLRMEDLVTINSAAFANKIMQVATADITEANFANYNGTSYVSAPAAFGWSDMGLIWGALKKANARHAILDGEYIAQLLNSPTFFQSGVTGANDNAGRFGWDGIHLNTEWSGAGAGCRGFACDPQAIGACSGLPLLPPQGVPGNTLQESVINLPDLGISIAVIAWFSTKTRSYWTSFDIMFGAEEIDTTAGIFIKAS
jgi:ATP-dependent Clp protease protease subunit